VLIEPITSRPRPHVARGALFAEVDVRGVLTSRSELHWMAGDTEVEMIEPPHYAGMPEDLVLQARPIASPSGSDGWPPLIQNSYPVTRCGEGVRRLRHYGRGQFRPDSTRCFHAERSATAFARVSRSDMILG
jgi:hypothetical protein